MNQGKPKLYLAPMLGITDVTFRNIYSKYFKGMDGSFAPFIKVNQLGEYKQSKLEELHPSQNLSLEVIPQIMCNHPIAFMAASQALVNFGYRQVNWNLGCPSPTTNTRALGCGLMPEYELVDRILESVFRDSNLKISIKTRLGLESSMDIIKLSEVFNRYPLDFVVIHPRTGKQGYSGTVDLEVFQQALDVLKHKVYYSGDIHSVQDYDSLVTRFPKVQGYLIGRGALRNPSLFSEINSRVFDNGQLFVTFSRFIDELAHAYRRRDFSNKDVMIRIKCLCFFFSEGQSLPRKQVKNIKKAGSIGEILEVLGNSNQYEE
jgi:tRNA-dihydrouridine synthase B